MTAGQNAFDSGELLKGTNMPYPVDLATGQMIEVYTTWYRCPVGCGGPQELQDPGITQRGWRCMDDFGFCPDCGTALIWPDAENASG